MMAIGEDAFYSYYIFIPIISKFQKFAKNSKRIPSSKKSQAR